MALTWEQYSAIAAAAGGDASVVAAYRTTRSSRWPMWAAGCAALLGGLAIASPAAVPVIDPAFTPLLVLVGAAATGWLIVEWGRRSGALTTLSRLGLSAAKVAFLELPPHLAAASTAAGQDAAASDVMASPGNPRPGGGMGRRRRSGTGTYTPNTRVAAASPAIPLHAMASPSTDAAGEPGGWGLAASRLAASTGFGGSLSGVEGSDALGVGGGSAGGASGTLPQDRLRHRLAATAAAAFRAVRDDRGAMRRGGRGRGRERGKGFARTKCPPRVGCAGR
jgi:hypothetical protein